MCATWSQAFVTTPWQLLGLRALLGIFTGGLFPGVMATIALRSPAARRGLDLDDRLVGLDLEEHVAFLDLLPFLLQPFEQRTGLLRHAEGRHDHVGGHGSDYLIGGARLWGDHRSPLPFIFLLDPGLQDYSDSTAFRVSSRARRLL